MKIDYRSRKLLDAATREFGHLYGTAARAARLHSPNWIGHTYPTGKMLADSHTAFGTERYRKFGDTWSGMPMRCFLKSLERADFEPLSEDWHAENQEPSTGKQISGSRLCAVLTHGRRSDGLLVTSSFSQGFLVSARLKGLRHWPPSDYHAHDIARVTLEWGREICMLGEDVADGFGALLAVLAGDREIPAFPEWYTRSDGGTPLMTTGFALLTEAELRRPNEEHLTGLFERRSAMVDDWWRDFLDFDGVRTLRDVMPEGA